MNKYKTICLIVISIICTQFVFADPPDWEYDPGLYEFTATLGAAIVNNNESYVSDNNGVLAAFDENAVCRGIAINLEAALGPYDGMIYHEMQIGSNASGDLIIFKYYDPTTDAILNIGSWTGDSVADYPYEFLINDIIGSQLNVVEMAAGVPVEGCMDADALNYDPNANVFFEGCCEYGCVDGLIGGAVPCDQGFDMGADCEAGLWGYTGDEVSEACPETCGCPEPCPGTDECDECGVCDDDASNDCAQDCNGDWGGSAEFDECDVCGGSGPEEGFDCDGNGLSIDGITMPNSYSIHSIYPNPFNPSTTIIFSIPEFSFTSIKVYDMKGMEIETLINEVLNVGKYSIVWNASSYPSGIYFIRILSGGSDVHSGGKIAQAQVVLIK